MNPDDILRINISERLLWTAVETRFCSGGFFSGPLFGFLSLFYVRSFHSTPKRERFK